MANETRNNNQKKTKHIMAIVAFICSIITGFIAMFMPPQGVIDTSVLWWIAQLLVFSSAILGIDFNINKITSNT